MALINNNDIYAKQLLKSGKTPENIAMDLYQKYNWDIVDAAKVAFQQISLNELSKSRISELFKILGIKEYNSSDLSAVDIIHNNSTIIQMNNFERFSPDTVRVTLTLFELGYLLSKGFIRNFPMPEDKKILNKKIYDILSQRTFHPKLTKETVNDIVKTRDFPVSMNVNCNRNSVDIDDESQIILLKEKNNMVVMHDIIQADALEEIYQDYQQRKALLNYKISLSITLI